MKIFKKLLLSFVLLLFFNKIYAYEITYSEWSDIKPDIEEYLIEEEDRFLFYSEKEINIEYLTKDNFGNKLYDMDDYKYSEESELLSIKPEEKDDRIITEVNSEYDNENNIYKIKLSYDLGVYISEVEIFDNSRNIISYEVEDDYNIIKDGLKEEYVFVKDLIISFDDKVSLHNFNVIIYYRSDNENDLLVYKYLNNEDKELYSANFDFKESPYRINNYLVDKIDYSIVQYKYTDKLYKTYEIEKEYIDDYYSELDGYIKDENTKKTFYRYITNDHILVDESNNIVKNPNTCAKEFCSLVYLTKEEEPPIEETPEVPEVPEEPKIPVNPKTIDNIHYFFIGLFVSLIILIILFREKIRKIFLVLSNRFKRV